MEETENKNLNSGSNPLKQSIGLHHLKLMLEKKMKEDILFYEDFTDKLNIVIDNLEGKHQKELEKYAKSRIKGNNNDKNFDIVLEELIRDNCFYKSGSLKPKYKIEEIARLKAFSWENRFLMTCNVKIDINQILSCIFEHELIKGDMS